MKRFFYLSSLAAFAFLLLTSAFPTPAHASVASDAQSYCASVGSSSASQSACMAGYTAEKKYEAKVSKDNEDTVCKRMALESDCRAGWEGAQKGTNGGSADAVANAEVANICGVYTGNDQKACAQGVTGYQKDSSATVDAVCKGASNGDICKNSWQAAKGKQNPVKASGDAIKHCQNEPLLEQQACEIGYESGFGNDPNDNACNQFADTKAGKAKTTCKEAYKSGKSALDAAAGIKTDNGPDHPTCESNGFPLNISFMICPFFNGVADMSDWLFKQVVQPLLHTTPLSTDPSDPSFQAWSNFRIYGNIFLVIALLVIVFGQSIGGGIVDAYTAKKVLPRLVIATVLINLSIYIVAALVDITNIIGGSLGTVMTAPLHDAGAFVIKPGAIQTGSLVGGGLAATSITAFLSGIFFAVAPALAVQFFGHASLFIALFVLMPVFFGLLAAFITLIVRQGLILGLVLVSPVAFALYCLPNTQQYFRKWWDLLVQTLIVYPIVIVFFAVADILSVTVVTSTQKGNVVHSATVGPLALIISFLLQFLPLLFIPYSFRLAGGLLGRAHELMTNYHKRAQEGIKGDARNPNSFRNRVKGNLAADLARGRAEQYRQLKNYGPENSRRRRWGQRLATGMTITGDPLQREAQLNEEAKQRIFQIKDNGDDSIINALASYVDDQGVRRRIDDDAVVNPADYASARRLHPRLPELQAAIDYRSTKVLTTDDQVRFLNNYARMAQDMGLSENEAMGLLTATSFARQNERGEMKHGTIERDATTGRFTFRPVGGEGSFAGDVLQNGQVVTPDGSRSAKFIKEAYARKGAYAGAQMSSSYFQAMGDIKKHHIDNLEGLEAASQTRQLTQDELASRQHSEEQLKQILEIQDAMEYSGQIQDPDNPGQTITKGGMSGASAETKAAFDRMKALDTTVVNVPTAGPVTRTGQGPAPVPVTRTRGVVQNLKNEIAAGNTYESQIGYDHGDASQRHP